MSLVLVTGGAGFIGSHLTEGLLEKNYRVRVLDNLVSGNRLWVSNHAEFIEGDICDLEICKQAMLGVEGVFHCAAMSRAGPSLEQIDVCTHTNIVGTQNILLASREAQVKKIIYSGSSTHYGNQAPPHHESQTAAEFLNFYALSKSVGEKYCLMFDELFNLPCIVLRYFNVYGPRQPMTGTYALVMGIFLQKWLNGEALEIHGDGTQSRDFIHVKDVVNANIMAYESSLRHEILNVGSGKAITIQEVADIISSYQIYTARRKGDADATLADISLIQSKLNWRPSINFKEALSAQKKELRN